MKTFLGKYGFLFGMAIVIVGLDQWTKALVRANLTFGSVWSPFEWLAPYARLVHWNNTGAAFGMLQGYNTIFSILAVVVSAAIVYYYPRVTSGDWLIRIAFGLMLGGALGNLVDRVAVGQVTDFISVGTFPVFNIADSSISVGVAVLLLGVWLKDAQDRRKANAAAPVDGGNETPPPGVEKHSGG